MKDPASTSSHGPSLQALDERFRRPLLSYFMRRVGDHAETEDLTQRVFVRLLGVEDLRTIDHAEAYVFTIAANLVKDRGRTLARSGIQDAPEPDFELAGEAMRDLVEDRSPERVLIGREALSQVLATLDELGDKTREIFILFRLENMKQREIAELLGIGQSTVEKHVMKATLHLANRYGSL
jgi:RNA polymerase sigma factor (sigma-70 family)